MKKFGLFIFAALAAVGGGLSLSVAQADIKPEVYQSGKGQFGQDLAVGGYDAVAYHKVGTPTVGSKDLVFAWKGATWRFATADNLAAFKAAPETFAPQYGGYCAYGLAQGYAVHGDPKQWSIVDGKLYLNYDADVQATWSKDRPGYIKTADQKWPTVLK